VSRRPSKIRAILIRLILLTVALALLAPAAASAATYTYDVPDLVEKPLIAVKKVTTVDVLLPAQITTEFRHLYSEGHGRSGSYRFDIGATRGCGGAGACFVADFRGRRGGKPSNPRKVTLRGGRRGYFRPMRCGASCAAPSLQWVRRGVLYTIEAKLGTQSTDRRILTRLANSALRNGPR
jgi:hypothetical protein